MRTLQTSPEGHLDFEQLCQDIDEFEPLPEHGMITVFRETPATEDDQPTQLDELILAGLVSPV